MIRTQLEMARRFGAATFWADFWGRWPPLATREWGHRLHLVGSLGQGGATYVNAALPNPPLGNPSAYQPYSVAVGPNACVPTSTANGLTYLENYMNYTLDLPSPFSTSPNAFGQVDDFAQRQQTFNLTKTDGMPAENYSDLGGTYTTYMFNGTRSWLDANNPAHNVTMSGEVATGTPGSWIQGAYAADTNVAANTTPTAGYLAGLLNAPGNAAIEPASRPGEKQKRCRKKPRASSDARGTHTTADGQIRVDVYFWATAGFSVISRATSSSNLTACGGNAPLRRSRS